MKINRTVHIQTILDLLNHSTIVAVLGARQVGKTTITRDIEKIYEKPVHRFDLEDPDDLARLTEPKLALQSLSGLVIIDEIQRRADLFPVLRVLVDRIDNSTTFLILGSASPGLLKQSSETLAGRILYYELPGFNTLEVGNENRDQLWVRGGFPRSYLAASPSASFTWRRGFIQTFLERDIPQLGVQIPAQTLYRFWSMLAHYHGQTWNGNELARAFGVSHTSVRRYLDILTGALVIWQLPPWMENLKKRQVKSAKVYFRDTGLLHALLGIRSEMELYRHPKIGASWEGFVICELIQKMNVDYKDCYFWGTHAGAELDLLVNYGTNRFGFEIKRTSSPHISASMRISIHDLKLDKLFIIHDGDHEFAMDQNIYALPFGKIRSSKIFKNIFCNKSSLTG